MCVCVCKMEEKEREREKRVWWGTGMRNEVYSLYGFVYFEILVFHPPNDPLFPIPNFEATDRMSTIYYFIHSFPHTLHPKRTQVWLSSRPDPTAVERWSIQALSKTKLVVGSSSFSLAARPYNKDSSTTIVPPPCRLWAPPHPTNHSCCHRRTTVHPSHHHHPRTTTTTTTTTSGPTSLTKATK